VQSVRDAGGVAAHPHDRFGCADAAQPYPS
jgi:hypothetical protein